MRSNLEQITWQLLSLVLTQNARQFRTNYLHGSCCHRYDIIQNAKQFWTNYLAAAPTILALNVKQFIMNYLPLIPQYWHKNVKQFRTNNLATTHTILAINVKQFRINSWPFFPQYWHKNVKQFRAIYLVAAATNTGKKLWSNLITNNLATAPIHTSTKCEAI